MSHLLHEYSKSLGVKVSKPDLQQHFFPSLDEKYIVFYDGEKQASKIYKHYSTVFQLLRETLDNHNIKIYLSYHSDKYRKIIHYKITNQP